MILLPICPHCGSTNHKIYNTYETKGNGKRTQYCCTDCGTYFSQTAGTIASGLRTPISIVILALKARTEGLSVNATCRLVGITKKTLLEWERRFGALKQTLLIYSLLHQYITLVIEGDELYTRVGKNTPADESMGWTVVLMDRASRFLWELCCGKKDRKLFRRALRTLVSVIKRTGDITLLTDGERRYGDVLFEICSEMLRTGKRGRPRKTLRKGVKVRIKNKGSQARKRGPKRPKYQAPCSEHPETKQDVSEASIHANHCEAFNSALRRRNSAFRRRSNTYAKDETALQRTLDIYWVVHNFVRTHFTTKQIPAVFLGIFDKGFSWADLFRIHMLPV